MQSKMEIIVRDRWLNADAKCRLCPKIFCCTEHRIAHENILHPKELRSILADISNKDNLNTTVRSIKVRHVDKEQATVTKSLKTLKATHSPDCTGKREREEVASPLPQSHKKKKKRISLLPHLKTPRDNPKSPLAMVNNGVSLVTFNNSTKNVLSMVDEVNFRNTSNTSDSFHALDNDKESLGTPNSDKKGHLAAVDSEMSLRTPNKSPKSLLTMVHSKECHSSKSSQFTSDDKKSIKTSSDSPKNRQRAIVNEKESPETPKNYTRSPIDKFDREVNPRTPQESPKSLLTMSNMEEYLRSPSSPKNHLIERSNDKHDSTIYVSADCSYDMLTSSPFASPDGSNFINLTPIEKSYPAKSVVLPAEQNSVEILFIGESVPMNPQLSETIILEDSNPINPGDSKTNPEILNEKQILNEQANINRTESSEMDITSESLINFNIKVQQSLSKISKKKNMQSEVLSEVNHENTNSAFQHRIDSGFQSETSNMIEENRPRRLSTDSDLSLRDCNVSRDFSFRFQPGKFAGLLDTSTPDDKLGDHFICLNPELKCHPHITYERGNNADLLDLSFDVGQFKKELDFLSPEKNQYEYQKNDSNTNVSDILDERSLDSDHDCKSEVQLNGVGYVNIETKEIYIPVKCFETELSTIHEISHFNTKHETNTNMITFDDNTVGEHTSNNECEVNNSNSVTVLTDISRIKHVNHNLFTGGEATVINKSYDQYKTNESTMSMKDPGSMCTEYPDSFKDETQEQDEGSENYSLSNHSMEPYTKSEILDRTAISFREEDWDLSVHSIQDLEYSREDSSFREQSALLSEGSVNYIIKIDDFLPSEESLVRKCISSITEKVVSLLPFKFSVTKKTCTAIDLDKYGLHYGDVEEHIRMRDPIREYTTTLELSRKLVRPIECRAPYYIPSSILPSVVTLKKESIKNESLFSEDDSYLN